MLPQQAADPHGGGHGVELDADALAGEVARAGDGAVVDGDEAVAEGARGEDGDGDQVARAGGVARRVLGHGHLRGVELAAADHAVEDVARVVDGDEVEGEAFGLDFAGGEGLHAVVAGAGEGEGEGGGHGGFGEVVVDVVVVWG